jgi:type I restriction enzyme M protein
LAKKSSHNGANLGFEQKLWQAADKLRNNMDAAEYKHVVLGLIFLKYISDAFGEMHKKLLAEKSHGADPEDPDEYRAENVFWVPKEARWEYLQNNAKKPVIGKLVDDAMDAIERDNPRLKGVLPKDYARPALDKQRLGELIDLIGTIGLGDRESRSKDILGRVYEYFLGMFADAEGKKGGQFYTPRSIVRLLVEMIEPYKGRVFDPCCGSGGMFVQSEKFVHAHGGRLGDIAIYGQESNQTTWRLCKMNLAIHSIDEDIQWNNEGSFLRDAHKDLKADFILANPPFNDSDWKGELLKDDARWKYGKPPVGNANFAWVQHFIHHLSPTGIAGFVLANASLSTTNLAEKEIRKNIIQSDLVDCIVLLPKQLFYNTMIPVCLWFISRDKKNHKFRNRSKEILFIDARNMGLMIDRRHKELTGDDINKIVNTYHSWKNKEEKYRDIPEFCRSVKIDDIEKHEYDLTPIRYIKINLPNRDNENFYNNIKRISSNLSERAKEFSILEADARRRLDEAGYKKFKNISFGYASNVNLSEFIRNIFTQWFIKFEFPDGKNKHHRSDKGDLVYSEELERKIPKGWEVIPITKVAKIIDCLHTKKPEPTDTANAGNILLQVYNIGEFGLLDLSNIFTVSDADYKEWTKNILLKEGDCIITNAGLTGAVAQIPHNFNCGIGRNITSIRPTEIKPSYLIEYLLSDYGTHQIKKHLDVGTIFDSLNVKGIKKFKILMPPEDSDIMQQFENIARPLRKIMEKNAYENLVLSPKSMKYAELAEPE